MMNFSPALFWDCDPASLDADQHRRFIVGRVLMRGKWEDWNELKRTYGREVIKRTVVELRELDPRTLAFCSAIFDIPKTDFRCFTSPVS